MCCLHKRVFFTVGEHVQDLANEDITGLVDDFHYYVYDNDGLMHIGDGGNDMYDWGNYVSFDVHWFIV